MSELITKDTCSSDKDITFSLLSYNKITPAKSCSKNPSSLNSSTKVIFKTPAKNNKTKLHASEKSLKFKVPTIEAVTPAGRVKIEATAECISMTTTPERYIYDSEQYLQHFFSIDTEEATHSNVSPACRRKIEQKPEYIPRTITPARSLTKERHLQKLSSIKTEDITSPTVTPYGRVKRELPINCIPKAITPAGRVTKKENLKIIIPAKMVTKDLSAAANQEVAKGKLQLLPSKISTKRLLVTQSARKSVGKSGLVGGEGRISGRKKESREDGADKENKENSGVAITPPTMHKPYIRPHTTRAISKNFFTQSGAVSACCKKELTYSDDEAEDAAVLSGDRGDDKVEDSDFNDIH